MAHVLITGGAGFIASHLVDELLAHGHRVTTLDIRPMSHEVRGVPHVRLDFTDHAALEQATATVRPELVCHLGAIPSVQTSILDAQASMTANVAGTYSVLEASRRAGVRRILLASSAAVYGRTALEHDGQALGEDLPLQVRVLRDSLGRNAARLRNRIDRAGMALATIRRQDLKGCWATFTVAG